MDTVIAPVVSTAAPNCEFELPFNVIAPAVLESPIAAVVVIAP